MKNKLKLLFIVVVFTFCGTAKGEIIPTYSVDSITIKNLDKLIDENTIVFIELDDVLVMPKSKMFYYGDNPYRLFIYELFSLSKTNPQYLNLIVKWYQMRKLMLVEEGWKNFIENLKKRKIPVYALCTMPIQMKNIEPKRLSELKELGISFTGKINDKDIMEIEKKEDHSSIFYHGIIFTGTSAKANVLLNFIKTTNISPKKIVVFGNSQEELQAIESNFYRFRINFYSILYLGARKFVDIPDPNVIRLQQQMLFDQEKWLEDEEAEALLKRTAKQKELPEVTEERK
ncbi:MAG: DUF2608 domain-containing protein [Candidatus Megaira endosymbiont of Carteria cerasiformis]|nr:DUF2608 domain-containing protein [Candidatus Megaera polyxenophila]MCC8460881.1 DUF2608 domain-containing protein [Candidatus Megaera polyxenophila]